MRELHRAPLLEIQKGILFDSQVGDPAAYTISAVMMFNDMDLNLLRQSLQLVIHEQEALRSCIMMEEEGPQLVVVDSYDAPIEELQHRDIASRINVDGSIAEELMDEILKKPIDLFDGPLFRLYVSPLIQQTSVCIFTIHHIICDGMSLELLKDRLLYYYNKLKQYESIELEADNGFTEYIKLENKKLELGKYKKHAVYWKDKMNQAEPIHIPPDKITHHEQGGVAKELRFPITHHQQVVEIAKQLEVTPFSIYMSIFTLLLKPYSSNNEVTYVTPITHRPKLSMEQSVGCFVHMLPIRMEVGRESSFNELVHAQMQELIQTYKYAGYPNNLIARNSNQLGLPGTPSIFDVSFVHDVIESEFNDVRVAASSVVTFPGQMMVVIEQSPQAVQLKIQFKPQTYSQETIELLGNRYEYLLQQCCADPSIKLEELEYVMPNERELILHSFNESEYFPYKPMSIIDRFEHRVAQCPQRVALIDSQRQLTYEEVQQSVHQLAGRLLACTNGEVKVIGIHMQRSIEMVISILAALRAGCAYVPLDPSYPMKRKSFIIQDASIACVITDQILQLDEELNLPVLTYSTLDVLDRMPEPLQQLPEITPDALAYIMYTSGSTGNPKGVMIEQHSVVNTLLDLERRFPMTADGVFMLKTAYTFDVSATELFGWFIGEGALYVLEPDGEKNPHLIVDCIDRFRITHLNFVPTMFRLFLDVIADRTTHRKLDSLTYLFVGGEAITPELLNKYDELNLKASLENVYGPTECTIWMSHYELNQYADQVNVPIGYPLNETRWYVVGESNQLQPIGVIGELCLSGVGLARGYVNMPQLTSEKFVPNPFYNESLDPPHFKKMYRTGDLVRWLPSGTIEYVGRIDFQVKLHGVRLEIGEIESSLSNYPDVVQAVVIVKKLEQSSRLCAFYLSEQEIEPAKLKAFLGDELPAYMIPEHYVHVNDIPKNSSGKADRKVLLAMLDQLQEETRSYEAPANSIEEHIAAIWERVLHIEKPSVETPFFELGGSSISLIQVHTKLQQSLSKQLPITALFQYVTIRQLAEHLGSEQFVTKQQSKKQSEQDRKQPTLHNREDIAIIGVAVRVPGANCLSQFWSNLVNGEESIHFYSDDELRQLGIDEQLIRHPQYVKAKGRVDGIDTFDHQLFDYTPGEVQMMSPQYRLMYKGVWDAFEDAGYDPTTGEQRIGLYLGGSDDFEWYRHMLLNQDAYSDQYQTFTLSTNHFLATRIAYKLNVTGPVYTALTGCSTSLVTPHLACQALQLGECDMAAAGGITVELPNEGGYVYEDGMMFSEDGHCRPFDASASGTMFSNGLGVVILKRLSDAVNDRDHIYGVIKGSAINNDGNSKLGFLAPSIEGQVDVIRQALEVAAIDPATISYVEAHGTGTLLGDPIEVSSLTQAFSVEEKQQCVLGSVKGNVGHMDTAAGIVGLAKVALSLKHRYLPGTVNYEQPNPKINFEHTPFQVYREGRTWQPTSSTNGLLRAGINSFGVGGTNAHMVLEQAPIVDRERSKPSRYHMMLVSAKTKTALEANAKQLASYMLEHDELLAEDVAWTLQVGRKHFKYRKAIVVHDKWQKQPEQWQQLLDAPTKQALSAARKLIFMFPGQGSQYQGMAKGLMTSEAHDGFTPLFRKYMDEMFSYIPQELRPSIVSIMYGDEDEQLIHQTQYSQLAIFMTSCAIALSMIELGFVPDAMIGHSIGELAAATVAGVFTLKDAIRIVIKRGQLMQQQPAGVMVAVMSEAARIQPMLTEDLQIALYNSSNACVVGGPAEPIELFKQQLDAQAIKYSVVKTSHAFHTRAMVEAAEQFEAYLTSTVTFHTSKYPVVSNVTGDWVDEKSWLTPQYWAKHITEAVRFEQNLDKVLTDEHAVFVEVGAGRTLSSFARMHRSKKDDHYFVSMLRHPQQQEHDEKFITERIAELWCYGVTPSFKTWYGDTACYRVSLPTYQYDERLYPIAFQGPAARVDAVTAISCAPPSSVESRLPKLSIAGNEAAVALEHTDDAALNIVLGAYEKLFGHNEIDAKSDFFELGGDSLKAVSLASILQQQCGIKLGMHILFEYVTPITLANYLQSQLQQQTSNQHTDLSVIDNGYDSSRTGTYPLSSAQIRMYTLCMLHPHDITWNVPSATLIEGKLDEAKLRQAIAYTMQRHEALRTSIQQRDGQLIQIVHEDVEVPLVCSDYRNRQLTIEQIIKAFVRPFDLTKAPLMRVEVARLNETQSVLLFDVHHMIADGTSVELITHDVNRFYFAEQVGPALPYRSFVDWLAQYKKDASYEKARQYWMLKLQAPRTQLTLPTDYARPDHLSNAGARVHFDIPTPIARKLRALATRNQSSMNMVLLTAWKLLLHRYTGSDDMIIGTAAAGRPDDKFRNTVGMFVNMLPIRTSIYAEDSFAGLLQRVKRSMLEALNYEQFQFDDLVQALEVTRVRNHNLLFDICFDYQNMQTYQLELEGMTFEPYSFDMNCASYDLLLTCHELQDKDSISGFIEYRTELYDSSTIEAIVGQLLQVLEAAVEREHEAIGSSKIVQIPNQQSLIQRSSSRIQSEHVERDDLNSCFVQQLQQSRHRVAIIESSGYQLTYEQLGEQVEQFAALFKSKGLKAGDRIALLMKRTAAIHAAMLACIRLKITFIPIDPSLPQERILYMLEKSTVSLALSDDRRMKLSVPIAFIDERFSFSTVADQNNEGRCLSDLPVTAAHIYTSGSTGMPKGVQVSEHSLMNFIEDVRLRGLFANDNDRIYSVTTVSFDIFLFESIIPLCLGGSIYLANEQEQLDPSLAARKIVQHECTYLLSTVSRIKAFVEHPLFTPALDQLNCIFTGGENVPASLVDYIFRYSKAALFNMYGPTETTIWSTVKQLYDSTDVTIGKPILNTEVYIVNEQLEPLPIGQYGELLIGGAGVSAGYVGEPERSAEQFIMLPNVSSGRLYRTGDRARMLETGELQLLGRMDTQVKIHGYRIELSEVEEQLLRNHTVQYAVAVVRAEGTEHAQIIAYVKPNEFIESERAPELERQLKHYLGELLPQYMLPSRIISLQHMPTLPNGKLDRKLLTAMANEEELLKTAVTTAIQGNENIALENGKAEKLLDSSKPTRYELQQRLTVLWQKTLQRNDVQLKHNYFDLGGQSLGLITIHGELSKWLSKEVPLVKLFEYPTIQGLVDYFVEEGLIRVNRPEGASAFAAASIESDQHRREALSSMSEHHRREAVSSLSDHHLREASGSMNDHRREAVSSISDHHDQQAAAAMNQNHASVKQEYADTDIAVIGMACQFPGASDVQQYWNNLVSGVESIRTFTEEELLASGVPLEDVHSPHYVRRKGYLDDVAYFDHQFFNYSLHEAASMDPQIRLLHQVTWHALEDGGYDPYHYKGKIGFFAGSGLSTPWLTRFIGEQKDLVQLFEAMTLNEKDYVTTRISYKLNLRGPSANVQTACSTSLVAIHQAIQSLLRNEADMALAGGVSISYPLKEGYMWHEGMIYSKDGYCRPFSEGATGTLSGNGCGVVLLKRLDQAIQDGDHIYAVVKGSAVNNDGHDKIGYTAPSVSGQKEVIQQAMRMARMDPEQIRYVEAHGTGTQLGDPIEINALQQAWQANEHQYCAIGSVKANIGHLDAAAGVAGFIKAVCIAQQRIAPPLLHYKGKHSQIMFEQSPFYINTEAKQLAQSNEPIAVAVSSFGIGGTNAHLVVSSPPEHSSSPFTMPHSDIAIWPLSAASSESLQHNCEQLKSWTTGQKELDIERVAYTLQTGRATLSHRQVFVLEQGHVDWSNPYVVEVNKEMEATQWLWSFVHRPSLYKGMTLGLYRSLLRTPITAYYEQQYSRLLEKLDGIHQQEIKLMMRDGIVRSERAELLYSFIVQYCLFNALQQTGFKPNRYVGQGVGELVAWSLVGYITAEDAISVIYRCEVQAWSSLSPGAMQYASYYEHALAQLPYELQSLVLRVKQNQALYDDDPILYAFDACTNDSNTSTSVDVYSWLHAEPTVIMQLTQSKDEFLSQLNQSSTTYYNVALLSEELMRNDMDEAAMVMRALAECWCYGLELSWEGLYSVIPRKLSLPGYCFERTQHEHDVKLTTMLGVKQANIEAEGKQHSSKQTTKKATLNEAELTAVIAQGWKEQLGDLELSPSSDFFELGAHSLHVIALVACIKRQLHIEVTIEEMFATSQLQQMVQLVWQRYKNHCEIVENNRLELMEVELNRVEQLRSYVASSAQTRLYVVQEMLGNSMPYHLASFYKLTGSLDVERLRTVVATLVARHEAFRTSFHMEEGRLVQRIHSKVPDVLEVISCEESEFDQYAERYIEPFDLSNPSLLRIKLFKFTSNTFALMIDMHHIISDQSSIGILLHEVAALYAGEQLPELQQHYRHYAAWQNESLQSAEMLQQQRYWHQQFADGVPQLELVSDFLRTAQTTAKGEKLSISLPDELNENIMQLCKQQGLTPFMLFIGTLQLLLWKYTASEDVVVGTAIAGRRRKEWQSIVGMFVNMLPIRTTIDEKLTIEQYFQHVKYRLVQAFDHQDYQYDMLVDDLKLEKQSNRNPLFDVVMNFINMGTDELSFGDLEFKEFTPAASIESKFDMTWTVLDHYQAFTVEVEFNRSLFRSATIERMLERFAALLSNVISSIMKDRDHTLETITLWDEQDDRWLAHCNATAVEYPMDATIPELFVETVNRVPEHIALRFGELSFTYAELNRRINALALLLKEQGAVNGQRVALYLSRGPMQIISILAALKLGCIYVPIDPEQPSERTEFMLNDSEALLVVTEERYREELIELSVRTLITVEQLDHFYDVDKSYPEPDGSALKASDVVYIVYTSGSTGTPKGVLISHRNVLKVVRNSNFVAVNDDDRIVQLSTYAFDGSVFDIFGALLNGASLVLTSKAQAIDIEQLASLIEHERITLMFITTALFNLLVEVNLNCLSSLRCIMFGGEAASYDHVKKAIEAIGADRLLNVYGPTETTFIATFHRLTEDEELAHNIPIGRPLSNTTLYVLDDKGRPVPPNVIGELYIGGAGVGIGYSNRPELTVERFIDDTFSKSGKLYRTGDRVWRREDGALVYVERTDFQVKIRGFRIELGEIEAKMKLLAQVNEAIVAVHKDQLGSSYLAAYYTERRGESRSELEVYEILQAHLPEYMVPKRMMRLEQMPLTLTGKIDRKQLPVIEKAIRSQPITAARNALESIILFEMKSVLDVDALGIHDDFFQAGGQSLKAIAFIQALKEYGIEISIQEVFSHSTASKLAALPKLQLMEQEAMVDEQRLKQINHRDTTHQEKMSSAIPAIMRMNKQQIDSTVQYLRHMNELLAQYIQHANVVHEFAWSPMQRVHAALGSSPSGFMTTVTGSREQLQLKQTIVRLIASHQLLHCVKDTEQQRWLQVELSQLDDALVQSIPYFDLSTLEQGKDELLIQLTKVILLETYLENQLPWRIAIVKLTAEEHRIIWGLDHMIFDGMSAQVLMEGITAQLDSPIGTTASLAFDRYVALLEQGPSEIDERAIIERFQLEEWQLAQQQWELIGTQRIAEVSEKASSLEFKLKLQNDQLQQQWWSLLQTVVQALSDIAQVPQLPLAVVHYGRQYGDEQFYDCVGEFLDIVPMLMSTSLSADEWFNVMELIKRHHLNFMALLHDEKLAEKYAKVRQYLSTLAVTAESYRCILFNFQGYIPSENRVDATWQEELQQDPQQELQQELQQEPQQEPQQGPQQELQQEPQHVPQQELQQKQPSLASMMVTMYYDETHLYIQLESDHGFDRKQLMEGIQSGSSGLLEWNDEKGVELIHGR